MVTRPGSYQASFNAGELSPELHGNTNLKQYYSGAARMVNVEPVPQGGFRLTPRSAYRAPLRAPLSGAWSVAAYTSPGLSAAGQGETWSLGVARSVAVIDLIGLSSTIANAARILRVELLTALGWIAIGGDLPLTTSPVNRRLALPPGAPLRALSLRVSISAAVPAPLAISLANLIVYEEAGAASDHRLADFTVSRDVAYVGVFTPGHVDFFRDGAFIGCCAHPFTAAQLPDLKWKQRDETMLLFHRDAQTGRILRRGVDFEWSYTAAPFAKIPDVDLGGTYVNVPEKWQVWFRWASGTTVTGLDFVVSVDGEESPVVKIGAAWADTAALLKTALETLSAVDPGLTVSVVASPAPPANSQSLTVEFTGGRNPGSLFSLGGRPVSTSEMSLTTSRLTKGDKGGEPIMSASRGWPAVGCFWQDRLLLGGFKAKGGAWAASRSGEYFDFNIELASAAGALLINLDTDGAERIVHMARGAHLQIFTDRAEYFISDRALSRTAAVNVVRSSSIGANERVPVVEQESAALFISREGGIVYAHQYSNDAQAYVSEPLSLLASHLVFDIRGAALQQATTANDAQRYFLVREDGVMVVGLLIRNQDVTAFVQWKTDGRVRDVIVDGRNRAFVTVERMVAGAPRVFLEELQDGLLLDGAIMRESASDLTVVDGLAMHEGASVWAIADGYEAGPFVVVDGAIALPFASRSIVVGRWTPPDVIGLPLGRDVAPRIVNKRPARIYAVQLDLIGAQSLSVGANDAPPRAVALLRAGDPVNVPFAGYTGEVIVSALPGFSPAPVWRITQTRPGALHVRNVTTQARI